MVAINKRLRVVNLRCQTTLVDPRSWSYSFEFFDIRQNRSIGNINRLSAGQKAIVHLVFEAYGRGDLRGGLVIIDEPEIHLHYQFQHEFLKIIQDLNVSQNCQYILVTHSESLINSSTINSVRRLALNTSGHTQIFSPVLTSGQRSLIQILDNTRSTYAFFAKRVVLAEGASDAYFVRAFIKRYHADLEQDVAVLHIGGKRDFRKWRLLFADFGLHVSEIADFDYLSNLHYPNEVGVPLRTRQAVSDFKFRNPGWQERVIQEYGNQTYILQNGDLENYLNIKKGLDNVIEFCQKDMENYFNSTSVQVSEIKNLLELSIS